MRIRSFSCLVALSMSVSRDYLALVHPSPAPAQRQAPFIRGPLPLAWVQQACQLPGKTAQVALAIQYRCGLERSFVVTLTRSQVAAFGVERHAARRALKLLEAAGLIRYETRRGRSPRVTVAEGGRGW